jgi:ribosomal protein L18
MDRKLMKGAETIVFGADGTMYHGRVQLDFD